MIGKLVTDDLCACGSLLRFDENQSAFFCALGHPNTPSRCRVKFGRGVYGVGQQIGATAFYHWWKRACKNLGIKGVDLYGGTRHSSASAMAEYFTREEMRNSGTMHGTNKAFERYFQREAAPSRAIYQQIDQARRGQIKKQSREMG